MSDDQNRGRLFYMEGWTTPFLAKGLYYSPQKHSCQTTSTIQVRISKDDQHVLAYEPYLSHLNTYQTGNWGNS